ncbi:hypothetical protein EHQ81_13045 [Leptospira selangorensis]|uniref:Haem-binding uptake Tiki superfamily ChaN domain-containing protein n=1 Tax=Leptospira selangorensis TaxID=2484982 RepID=A0A5F2C6X4_9LEPT|nr:ChaN family lipoprotein [Leptospira selangorensis]TGM12805.1 hypothetical protein EHQ81_13045 [Leptospira selangorensis]TGM30866.1 hypothetical protein EHQ82_00885 [Leptospira selangorensis]
MLFRIFWLLLLFPTFLFSQTFNPEVYDSKSKSKVDLSSIIEKAKDADVIIFGEEHNDKVGHAWKLEAFKKLASTYSSLLSLEMLEKDQQRSVDEYCKGEITERGFLNSGKFWPNYQTDYHPMVSFAKEQNLPVLAANAPRKYVNLVSHQGLDSLYKIRSPFLPPRYTYNLFRQKEYEELLSAMIAEHSPTGFSPDKQKFIDAQYVWDASMADSIAEAYFLLKRKIVHVNGRFHSDKSLGLTYRLKQMGLNVLTVSIFPSEEGKSFQEEDWKLADFLVITERKPVP